jgi:hypothetical protein
MRHETNHHELPGLNRPYCQSTRHRRELPAVRLIRAAAARCLLAAAFALLCSIGAGGTGHAQAQNRASELLNALHLGNIVGDRRDSGGRFGFPFCSLAYDLPADVGALRQFAFDRLSWKSFLALNAPAVGERVSRHGDNDTQWSKWSSTDDLIQCQSDSEACVCPGDDCSVSGAHYYPEECRQIEGFENYRASPRSPRSTTAFSRRPTPASRTIPSWMPKDISCATRSW